jgi:hypothetical protein
VHEDAEQRRKRLRVNSEIEQRGVQREMAGAVNAALLEYGPGLLTNCISCHNHHHSPVEAATSPDLGSILAVSLRAASDAGDTCTRFSLARSSFVIRVITSPSSTPGNTGRCDLRPLPAW